MEGNNNDKGAMETIKNKAKEEAKKAKNKVVFNIIKFVAPYVGIVLLCLLAVGVIMATAYSIINFFKGLFGIDAATESSVLNEAQSIISITNSGYKINDEYSKKILEDLDAQMVDTEEMGFATDDLSDMIDKYIKAEIKKMYPTIGKGSVDGLIKIQRMSAETGTVQQLTYIDYQSFKKKVEQNDSNVTNYFSLNPGTFDLCIAVSETSIYYDYDENSTDKRKEISRSTYITMREIEYQTTVQRYATPLNYFISMHLISADKDFMNDILELVDGQTDIVLTFLESADKEFIQVDYEGKITTTEYETIGVLKELEDENSEDDTSEEGSEDTSQEKTESSSSSTDLKFPLTFPNTNVKPVLPNVPTLPDLDIEPIEPMEPTLPIEPTYITVYEYSELNTTETIVDTGNISNYSEYVTPSQYLIEKVCNTGELFVTNANTWFLKSNLGIQIHDMQKENIQTNTETKANIDESNDAVKDRVYKGSYNVGWINEITNEWTEKYRISTTENAGGYNLTDITNLIKSYPKVKNNLETSPTLLFYLLEENENTQELAKIMKYIIYTLTDIDYGVTDLDLDIYDSADFFDVSAPIKFQVDYIQAAGYTFPHYLQKNYPRRYGTSTIPKAGCGPTSLAMILAGLKDDTSINPRSVVSDIEEYWPNGGYYVADKGSSHCIFHNNDFLKKYYGVSSVAYPTEAQALQALQQGYPIIGGEDGHILALIPAPDEYKEQGYKFYILDSARGHDGLYQNVQQANNVVDGNLRFIAIIKPE